MGEGISDMMRMVMQQVIKSRAALTQHDAGIANEIVHYETRINDRAVDPLTFERRGYKSC